MAATLATALLIFFLPLPFDRVEPAYIENTDNTSDHLPDVLALGDSVTLQYYPFLVMRMRHCVDFHEARHVSRQSIWSRLLDPEKKRINMRDSGNLKRQLTGGLVSGSFDLILVNAGLHDLKSFAPGGISATQSSRYEANIRGILEYLRKHSPRVAFVATTPVLASRSTYASPEGVEQLNKLAAHAAADSGMSFLSLGLGSQGQLADLFLEDGVHLNKAGARMAAQAMQKHIVELLRLDSGSACRVLQESSWQDRPDVLTVIAKNRLGR